MKKIAIVLPAYEPDEKFVLLCEKLQPYLSENLFILSVNDGSDKECCGGFFEQVASLEHCTVLHHGQNRGKGAALKTAFKYLEEQYANDPEFAGCVTADCDGQHPLEDILQTVDTLRQYSDELILGCRDFSAADLPWKSRFGNRCTASVFKHLLHCDINDTQTGLRGIPRQFMQKCCLLKGDRFEFETQMLLLAIRTGCAIKKVSTKTIYFDQNSGTHFRPVKDAFIIYSAIVRHLWKNFCFFAVTSMSAALLDIGIFSLLYHLCLRDLPDFSLGNKVFEGSLLASCVTARICSSLWNYIVNCKLVFAAKNGKKNNTLRSLLKYYLLAILLLTASWLLTNFFGSMLPEKFIVPVKAVVDLVLFLFSYIIQKSIVFR